MNHVERFRAVMDFQPVDRLPRWEWAMWWDKTIERWQGEGLPKELHYSQVFDIAQYFGLDPYQQFWFSTTDPTIAATQHHVEGMVSNMDDYLRVRPQLFPDHGASIRQMADWAERQRRGEAVVWATLEGFFWFPRTLMGFEKMMYAYEDEPELLHLINQDLLAFNFKLLDQMLDVCVPTFMTIAEDMSYNSGPMISKPRSRSVARLACVAGLRHISLCMAGARSTGASLASTVVPSKSSARPCASFAMVLAVAGAITMRSALWPSATWRTSATPS